MTNINMHRINNLIQNTVKNNSTQNKVKTDKETSFKDMLNGIQNQDIKFSKHAQMRMDQRNLKLDSKDMKKLEKAISNSEKKGVKEALIIMKDQAFIASVANRTIITAVSNEGLKENIFTNIDGAVII